MASTAINEFRLTGAIEMKADQWDRLERIIARHVCYMLFTRSSDDKETVAESDNTKTTARQTAPSIVVNNHRVQMAHFFLAGIVSSAIERGDRGMRLCADNANEALIDLETALAEIAAISDDQVYGARGIARRALDGT